jgi:hypothetical protein
LPHSPLTRAFSSEVKCTMMSGLGACWWSRSRECQKQVCITARSRGLFILHCWGPDPLFSVALQSHWSSWTVSLVGGVRSREGQLCRMYTELKIMYAGSWDIITVFNCSLLPNNTIIHLFPWLCTLFSSKIMSISFIPLFQEKLVSRN